MRYLIAACLAMGLALTACSDKDKEATPAPAVETASPAADSGMMEEAVDAAKDAADAAMEAATDAGEAVVEGAKEVAAETADMAGSAMDKAKETAADVMPAAKEDAAPAMPAEAKAVTKPAPAPAAPVTPVVPKPAPAPAAAPTGDATAGAAKVGKCKACHTFDAGGKHKVGPNLFGVYGQVAGKADGYSKYSSSLKNATFKWDDAALAAWVCNSKSAVKTLTGDAGAKSKMSKQNVCGDDALNVAAYLKTLR